MNISSAYTRSGLSDCKNCITCSFGFFDVDPLCAKTGICLGNFINIMAIDNLATQAAKASAAMILTIHVSPAFVTNGEGLKLSALLQCSQMPICMFAVFVSWYAEMKSCAQQCAGSRTQRTRPRNLAGNMMTSSNGNILRVTGLLCGEFTGPGEFPTQRPVTRSFDVFFDLRLKKTVE